VNGQDKISPVTLIETLAAKIAAGEDVRADGQVVADLGRALEEIRRMAEFDFRELGDHVYDGIYIADGAGKTLYVNKAYTRITGISPEEVVGKYVGECEAAGLYKNAVTPEVIRSKKQVNSMAESLKNGRKMLITGNPVFDEYGNVKNVVVIDREITDLLAMKAELEVSQEKMKAVEADKVKNIQEIEHLRRQHLTSNLIGKSRETAKIVATIRQVAALDVTVLIVGETGVGKEVVANEIYMNSLRSKGPFIKVNCAAIPANLLEAELFGYEKGAFTGATGTGKLGLFEVADKGTLLLDEIGDMPLELQSKLLRVIQYKEISRIGGTKPIKLDVRILAATNSELPTLVKQGRFREDLYYRLNVFPIVIPPLRARVEDLEALVEHFLDVYNAKYGKAAFVDDGGLEMMKQYSWPGNVRELQNIVERLVIVAGPVAVIGGEQLAPLLNVNHGYAEPASRETGLREMVANMERKAIERALALHGSTRKAARALKIDQSTIVKKAKKLGVVMPMTNGIGGDDELHRA
jgi:PAS domain S-box-containing protein